MDKAFKGIYKRRKIFITGHTGFKGGWLALWLKVLGAEVLGYSLEPPTVPSFFEAVDLESLVDHHIIGDVRDGEKLASVMREFKPEFVFHLAAQPLVRLSYDEPKMTFDTNVGGTVNILEAVRLTPSVKVLVNITSDKCYENKEWVYGYREIDPMGGYDPYSSSKGCSELVTAAYRNSFFRQNGVALSSVRAGNVIGGGDWGEDRLIPDCVKALSQDKMIVIRNPEAMRPWQYVLEPLAGYLLLGALMYEDGLKYSGPWNFGPDDESALTVEELARLVIKHWGSGNYTTDTSDQPHEARLLKLDVSKARALLGWRPIYTVYEAVEKTINWYKNFYNGMRKEKLHEFTIKEIQEYVNLSSPSLLLTSGMTLAKIDTRNV